MTADPTLLILTSIIMSSFFSHPLITPESLREWKTSTFVHDCLCAAHQGVVQGHVNYWGNVVVSLLLEIGAVKQQEIRTQLDNVASGAHDGETNADGRDHLDELIAIS